MKKIKKSVNAEYVNYWERGSPWNTPRDIAKGVKDQAGVTTVAEVRVKIFDIRLNFRREVISKECIFKMRE